MTDYSAYQITSDTEYSEAGLAVLTHYDPCDWSEIVEGYSVTAVLETIKRHEAFHVHNGKPAYCGYCGKPLAGHPYEPIKSDVNRTSRVINFGDLEPDRGKRLTDAFGRRVIAHKGGGWFWPNHSRIPVLWGEIGEHCFPVTEVIEP